MEKETQGHKKMIQYIEDLMRNKHFLKNFNKLRKELGSDEIGERDERLSGLMSDLYGDYIEMEKLMRAIDKRMRTRSTRIYEKMASIYGLDNDLFQEIEFDKIRGKDDIQLGDYADFCQVIDKLNDEYDMANYPPLPISIDYRKQRHIAAYPVSIDIHQFATKRDVLDFIEKRWSLVEEYLENYRKGKIRFRSRKIPRKIADFLWDNRQLNSSELKKLLDKNFSDNRLAYYEIHKIISQERKRRTKKFTVGQ